MTQITLLDSPNWKDYALLDSGNGLKLERFGPYTFVRPEAQAMWSPALPEQDWAAAHAVFQPTGEESGGHWQFKNRVDEKWEMGYQLASPHFRSQKDERKEGGLRFYAMTTPGRHLGVFPEVAAHWDWMVERIHHRAHGEHGEKEKISVDFAISVANPQPRILNLFGYTGLATLACAAAGAQVTHVDASKKSVGWARENQALSGLADKPVRWLVDDALKFVQREARRGSRYDGIVLDPPKFGRGPKGEVWEVYKSLPRLLDACREVLNPNPLFVVLTIYAVQASAIHAGQALADTMMGLGGAIEQGELVTRERSAGRLLSQAVYARWMME